MIHFWPFRDLYIHRCLPPGRWEANMIGHRHRRIPGTWNIFHTTSQPGVGREAQDGEWGSRWRTHTSPGVQRWAPHWNLLYLIALTMINIELMCMMTIRTGRRWQAMVGVQWVKLGWGDRLSWMCQWLRRRLCMCMRESPAIFCIWKALSPYTLSFLTYIIVMETWWFNSELKCNQHILAPTSFGDSWHQIEVSS